jgi:hypothetical protein
MDFAGGSGTPLDQDSGCVRVRSKIDWANRSIMAGLESPIFAPREPDSLAQVEFRALAGAGNLWLWMPQVRFEQKLRFTDQTGVRAQIGAVQTSEVTSLPAGRRAGAGACPAGPGRPFRVLPSLQGGAQDGPASKSRPASIPASRTWPACPCRPTCSRSTGSPIPGEAGIHRRIFHRTKWGPVGGLEGFTILPTGVAIPVHSQGGWGQFTFLATSRLSFHFFSGLENGRSTDLEAYAIGRNWLYGANFFYRLAPNVLLGAEVSQARTTYIDSRFSIEQSL